MAQTIKIKRSTGSSAPSTLANGELAYLNNATHKKLYIGRPGGGTGDIDVIGGKDFTDKADAALARTGGAMTGAITTSSTFDGRNVSTDGTKLDGIEAGADVTDATNVAAAGAVMTTGGSLSSHLSFGDNVKAQFGNQTNGDLQIYHDGDNSIIKDSGTGILRYTSANSTAQGVVLEVENTDSNNLSGSFIHFKDSLGITPAKIGALSNEMYLMRGSNNDRILVTNGSAVELYNADNKVFETTSSGINVVGTVEFDGLSGTGSVTVTDILDQDDMSSNSATALATQQSIKAYAANVTLTADNTTNASHYIPFANSATGNQGLQTDNALSYNPSTNGLSVGTSGNIATGTLSVATSIHGPSTFYIDPAPDDTGEVGGATTDTGTVVILGDLRVTGETTTVNSTTVSVGDNEIVLNGDHTGTPTLDAGLRVERGSLNDAFFNWDESEDSWVVGEGQSSSPYFYTLLHSNNFETAYTGNIDGGSF